MKISLGAVAKFVEGLKRDTSLAIMEKTVAGECDFREGTAHFSATVEFAAGKATLTADQPPFLGGGGSAPDPVQYCLFGTASCFAGTMMLLIAQRALAVDSLRVTVKNRVNLQRSLGLSQAPIVERVWIEMEYTGTAPQAEMDDVVREALETCPGAYCLRNPIPLSAEIRKA